MPPQLQMLLAISCIELIAVHPYNIHTYFSDIYTIISTFTFYRIGLQSYLIEFLVVPVRVDVGQLSDHSVVFSDPHGVKGSQTGLLGCAVITWGGGGQRRGGGQLRSDN